MLLSGSLSLSVYVQDIVCRSNNFISLRVHAAPKTTRWLAAPFALAPNTMCVYLFQIASEMRSLSLYVVLVCVLCEEKKRYCTWLTWIQMGAQHTYTQNKTAFCVLMFGDGKNKLVWRWLWGHCVYAPDPSGIVTATDIILHVLIKNNCVTHMKIGEKCHADWCYKFSNFQSFYFCSYIYC